MKGLLILLLTLGLLLSGCTPGSIPAENKQYTATFLDLFDTVTTVVGRAESEEAFSVAARQVRDDLERYHRLFDIYETYEGIHNLKTLNDAAGGEPVAVDEDIIRLLKDCKVFYEVTGGVVNVAMGSVLKLWHDARQDSIHDPSKAYLPDKAALQAAAEHTDLSKVVIDEAASTVCITDPLLRLDVGAIAKGWAAQKVAEAAPEGLLISVGGNVCATGPKDTDGTPWVVGIQDPRNTENYLHTIRVTGGSVVTSGDYQRLFAVDGKAYHHIIDPETLFPSAHWRSVTVVCPDSGVADALSTALFLLPQEEGQALLTRYQAEALWVDGTGERFYSPGFSLLIRT